MSSNNGNAGIYVEGFALQKGTSPKNFTLSILPNRSTVALQEFIASLPDSKYSLEQRQNGEIWIYNDGSVELKLQGNGHANHPISLDPHEARNLASILRDIGSAKIDTRTLEYRRDAQNRLVEFIGIYT